MIVRNQCIDRSSPNLHNAWVQARPDHPLPPAKPDRERHPAHLQCVQPAQHRATRARPDRMGVVRENLTVAGLTSPTSSLRVETSVR